MARYIESQRYENANGTISVTPRIPIEPPRPDPAANRIGYADMLRKFDWTDDDFQAAVTRNFPRPVAYKMSGWVHVTRLAFYSRTQVNMWLEVERDFAKKLLKLSV